MAEELTPEERMKQEYIRQQKIQIVRAQQPAATMAKDFMCSTFGHKMNKLHMGGDFQYARCNRCERLYYSSAEGYRWSPWQEIIVGPIEDMDTAE